MKRYKLIAEDDGRLSVAVHVDVEWNGQGWRATDDLGGVTQDSGSRTSVAVALEQLGKRLGAAPSEPTYGGRTRARLVEILGENGAENYISFREPDRG